MRAPITVFNRPPKSPQLQRHGVVTVDVTPNAPHDKTRGEFRDGVARHMGCTMAEVAVKNGPSGWIAYVSKRKDPA